MTIFAGLDVSDKTTHICVVDDGGGIAWRGVCATDPEALAGTRAQASRIVAQALAFRSQFPVELRRLPGR
jgi:hypothetical protein